MPEPGQAAPVCLPERPTWPTLLPALMLLDELENQSIYILREAYSQIEKLAMLWSIGKDSTVLLHLARKAFLGHVPFPLIHIDEYTVYALDHASRTINFKMNNSYLYNLRILKKIFRNPEFREKISKKIRNESNSNSYFGMARYYISNKNKFMAIVFLLASILKFPGHEQTQHKIFLILKQFYLIKEKKA